jgi:hypothetical protein
MLPHLSSKTEYSIQDNVITVEDHGVYLCPLQSLTVCFLFVHVFSIIYPRKQTALLKPIEESRWVPLRRYNLQCNYNSLSMQ